MSNKPLLTAKQLRQAVSDGLRDYRRMWREPGYIGMSQVAKPPESIYRDFFSDPTSPPPDTMAFYHFCGYAVENGIFDLLRYCREADLLPSDLIVERGRELVAEFDSRYRGHTDLDAYRDGSPDQRIAIDVKTVTWKKMVDLRQGQYVDSAYGDNSMQMQAYLRHGNYQHGILLFVCRDIDYREVMQQGDELAKRTAIHQAIWAIDVEPNPDIQDELDDKIKLVLKAIDANDINLLYGLAEIHEDEIPF